MKGIIDAFNCTRLRLKLEVQVQNIVFNLFCGLATFLYFSFLNVVHGITMEFQLFIYAFDPDILLYVFHIQYSSRREAYLGCYRFL